MVEVATGKTQSSCPRLCVSYYARARARARAREDTSAAPLSDSTWGGVTPAIFFISHNCKETTLSEVA